MLLYNRDFAIATSQNSVCITQQMCHKMILFQNCFEDESARKNLKKICHFLNNFGFLMMGKLASKRTFCDAAVTTPGRQYRTQCVKDILNYVFK